MASYPNQRKVLIQKEKEGDIFFMLDWNDMCAAAKDLSASAFKLFLYLAKNKDGFELWLSPKDYCDTFDVSDKTYRNAKSELIDKGYMKELDNNNIIFNTKGAFKKTRQNVKAELVRLCKIIEVNSQSAAENLRNEMIKQDLHNIKDDNVYIVKAEKCIDYAIHLIEEFSDKKYDNLC